VSRCMSMAGPRRLLCLSLARVKRFLRGTPGAAFVLGFQVLIVACAGLLILDLGWLAEGAAVVAYFLLVAGVIVQLAWFLRHG